jgi:large subunit ribosomal protein L10
MIAMMSEATTADRQRKNYPKKKRQMYQEIQVLAKSYNVIALTKMTKVRSTQLMLIRKKFRDSIMIRIIKNKVVQKAFEKVDDIKTLSDLSKELEGQCALMFTNLSPFKLNLIFAQNKVLLPAKGGDIATMQITIPAGNTGLTPGPVLSEFKEANVATKIDQGSIWINRDNIVANPGDVISQKLASLLGKLGIKPIEAGIAVNFALSEGLLFKEDDLRISLTEYRTDLVNSFQQALSVAIELGYLTPESIKPILVRADQYAKTLSVQAGYLSPDTTDLVLYMAELKAQNLAAETRKYGYDPTP